MKQTSKAWRVDVHIRCWRHAPSWSTFDEMSRTRCAVAQGSRPLPWQSRIKALLEKIVVIMREAPHLRMLFNPMMLAYSSLVISTAPVTIETDVSCTWNRNHVRMSPAAISCGSASPGRAGCLHIELLQHLDRQRVTAGVDERYGAVALCCLGRIEADGIEQDIGIEEAQRHSRRPCTSSRDKRSPAEKSRICARRSLIEKNN